MPPHRHSNLVLIAIIKKKDCAFHIFRYEFSVLFLLILILIKYLLRCIHVGFFLFEFWWMSSWVSLSIISLLPSFVFSPYVHILSVHGVNVGDEHWHLNNDGSVAGLRWTELLKKKSLSNASKSLGDLTHWQNFMPLRLRGIGGVTFGVMRRYDRRQEVFFALRLLRNIAIGSSQACRSATGEYTALVHSERLGHHSWKIPI